MPTLKRKLAAFIYESIMVFGVIVAVSIIYQITIQTFFQKNYFSKINLQIIVFFILGFYFTWFWKHGGQTLAMKTWKIKLKTNSNQYLSLFEAWKRYFLCWIWVLPPLYFCKYTRSVFLYFIFIISWIIIYAFSSKLNRKKQFFHDIFCQTKIVIQ
jgi:uncharacterized RDD family membrane protein YckC